MQKYVFINKLPINKDYITVFLRYYFLSLNVYPAYLSIVEQKLMNLTYLCTEVH